MGDRAVHHVNDRLLLAGMVVIAGNLSAIAWAGDTKKPGSDPVLARGEHIARLICATCHVVASDQEYPPLLDQPTPSFSAIANRPGMDAKSIQKFITTTHWDDKTLPMTMPNLQLTNQEAVGVARYILSLRRP
jgi:mono/diheme cytochrome c family protein